MSSVDFMVFTINGFLSFGLSQGIKVASYYGVSGYSSSPMEVLLGA
jgi:hypothetical protein